MISDGGKINVELRKRNFGFRIANVGLRRKEISNVEFRILENGDFEY